MSDFWGPLLLSSEMASLHLISDNIYGVNGIDGFFNLTPLARTIGSPVKFKRALRGAPNKKLRMGGSLMLRKNMAQTTISLALAFGISMGAVPASAETVASGRGRVKPSWRTTA